MKLRPADSPLGKLMATLPQIGHVEWIGLRPQRGVAMNEVEEAMAITGAGLLGDRYQGGLCARILEGGPIRRGDTVAAALEP